MCEKRKCSVMLAGFGWVIAPSNPSRFSIRRASTLEAHKGRLVRTKLTDQIVEHGVHRPDTLWRHSPRRSVTLDTPSTLSTPLETTTETSPTCPTSPTSPRSQAPGTSMVSCSPSPAHVPGRLPFPKRLKTRHEDGSVGNLTAAGASEAPGGSVKDKLLGLRDTRLTPSASVSPPVSPQSARTQVRGTHNVAAWSEPNHMDS
jgi:hypothetical protein